MVKLTKESQADARRVLSSTWQTLRKATEAGVQVRGAGPSSFPWDTVNRKRSLNPLLLEICGSIIDQDTDSVYVVFIESDKAQCQYQKYTSEEWQGAGLSGSTWSLKDWKLKKEDRSKMLESITSDEFVKWTDMVLHAQDGRDVTETFAQLDTDRTEARAEGSVDAGSSSDGTKKSLWELLLPFQELYLERASEKRGLREEANRRNGETSEMTQVDEEGVVRNQDRGKEDWGRARMRDAEMEVESYNRPYWAPPDDGSDILMPGDYDPQHNREWQRRDDLQYGLLAMSGSGGGETSRQGGKGKRRRH